MSESTDADEWQQGLRLAKVIDKQPKLFSKWVALKEKFSELGWADANPATEPPFYIADALAMINEAFDDGREHQYATID